MPGAYQHEAPASDSCPTAPPGAQSTVAQGSNNAVDIAGLYLGDDDETHGFVLSKGVYIPVDVPDSVWTEVYSINAKGEIVGAYEDLEGVVHGFLGSVRKKPR